MSRSCPLAPLVLLMLTGTVLNASAQTPAPTKDQLAWNHAWDAYEEMLLRNLGPNDRLMIFEQPLPIDWTTNQGGARKVQSVAAALPGYVFSWAPEAKFAYLHDAYKRYVTDVLIKMPTQAQQVGLEAAQAEFDRAGIAYGPAVDNLNRPVFSRHPEPQKV